MIFTSVVWHGTNRLSIFDPTILEVCRSRRAIVLSRHLPGSEMEPSVTISPAWRRSALDLDRAEFRSTSRCWRSAAPAEDRAQIVRGEPKRARSCTGVHNDTPDSIDLDIA